MENSHLKRDQFRHKFKRKFTQTAPAKSRTREPPTKTSKNEKRSCLKIATLNVRGLNVILKREKIATWLEKENIDVLAIQETKINVAMAETWKAPKGTKYTIYTSTSIKDKDRELVDNIRTKGKRPTQEQACRSIEKHGVGIIIRNSLFEDIKIESKGGRIIRLESKKSKVAFTSAYAPTTDKEEEELADFYNNLSLTTEEIPSRYKMFILGDFNAQILKRENEFEAELIGKHIFHDQEAHQQLADQWKRKLETARNEFVNFCIEKDLVVANTWFKKKDANLVSYSKEPIPANDPPYNGNRYSQIDYILTKRKWRNNVMDVSNQIDAHLDAFIDHFPIIAKIKCKFKKRSLNRENK